MISALVLSAVLSGQTAPTADPDCLDDNLTDRCATENRAEVLAKLGMASIEDEAQAGAEVVRILYVDGYGNDLPALSFERRAGDGPVVRVYGAEGRTLSVPISTTDWSSVLTRARFSDRTLVDLPAEPMQPDAMPGICLHSWVVSVEMSNIPTGRSPMPSTRQRTEDSCSAGLTTAFAFEAAEIARKTLAPCTGLDIERQRNAVTLIATCLSLGGDRLAASAVLERAGAGSPRYGLDQQDANTWRAYLGTNGSPRLKWGDQTIVTQRGSNNLVAQFVVEQVRGSRRLTFAPQRFHGLSSRAVEVEGVVTRSVGDSDPLTVTQANYRQTWIWDPNLSDWMVSEWQVDAFTPWVR